MKFLKVIVIALITVFAFDKAEAQLSVKVGEHPQQHRKVVVVERHGHYKPHHRHMPVRHPGRHH